MALRVPPSAKTSTSSAEPAEAVSGAPPIGRVQLRGIPYAEQVALLQPAGGSPGPPVQREDEPGSNTSGTQVRVTDETRLRSAPDREASSVARVLVNTILEQSAVVDDDWSSVDYRGATAYVRTDDISEDLTASEHEVEGAGGEVSEVIQSNGLNVGFHRNDYPLHQDAAGEWKDSNPEIRRKSEEWAETCDGVGIQGGRLESGATNRADSVAELVSKANAIVMGARALMGRDDLKIDTLAIGVHGLPTYLRLPEEVGDRSDTLGNSEAEMQRFVDAVRAYLSADVQIVLLACSAGRGTEETASSEEDQAHRGGSGYGDQDPRGEGSFGSLLSEELDSAGVDHATVAARTIRGHTSRNRFVRLFGDEAGDAAEGVDGVNYVFDDGFLAAEAQRLLGPTLLPIEDEAAVDQPSPEEQVALLRSKAGYVWEAIGRLGYRGTPDEATDADGREFTLSRDFMTNPRAVRSLLQRFWRERLVTDAASLEGLDIATTRAAWTEWMAEQEAPHHDAPIILPIL